MDSLELNQQGSSGSQGAALSEPEASLTGSTLYLMVAKTIAFVLTLALPLLLVRRLSQANFGLYKQIFLIVTTSVTVLPMGFAMNAFYFFPREPDRKPAAVFNILLFYFSVAVLVWSALMLFPWVFSLIFNNPELTRYAPLIGLVIFLWTVTAVLEILMIANQEPKHAAAFIACAHLTKTIALVIAALSFASVKALVYAATVQGVVQAAVLVWYLGTRFPSSWIQCDWPLMRSQLSYALPLGGAALLYFLQMDLHHYVVSYRFGAATYAIYAVGSFQLPLVGILSDSVGSVLIPRVSHLQAYNDSQGILHLLARASRKLAAVYFPLYGYLMVVGPEFIRVLFTDQYLASWPVFAVNLTLIPLGILASACDPVIRAYSEHRYFYIRLRLVLSTVSVLGLWLLTARFELLGAISVVVGVITIERLLTAVKVGGILHVSAKHLRLFKDVGMLVVAAAAAAAITEGARQMWLGRAPWLLLSACAAVYALSYLTMVHLLRILEPEERDAIRQYLVLRPFGRGAG
jgi:O-antigen/teichoic acid export membrane protein